MSVEKLIAEISSKDEASKETFNSVMKEKIGLKLESLKQSVMSKMFGGITENFSEGDAVKVVGKRIQGEGRVGVIHMTAPGGHFHVVKFGDGSKVSYDESNLVKHNVDEDENK